MRFKIESSWYYDTYEQLIKKYPCLKDFGFEVEKKNIVRFEKIKDEEGEILKQEYEKSIYTPYIYIYGLEELRRLRESVHHCLIIDWDGDEASIEIYDGYRE